MRSVTFTKWKTRSSDCQQRIDLIGLLCSSFISVQKFFRIMHSLERSGFPVELDDAGLPFANDPVLIDVNDCVHDDVPLNFDICRLK